MEKDNIIRIAKFMGATVFETPIGHAKRDIGFGEVVNGLHVHTWEGLPYHSDWKLLMPVIEKISKIPFDGRDTFYPRTFGMQDDEGNFMFRFNSHCLFTHKELIKAAYAAVCDFLENYKS